MFTDDVKEEEEKYEDSSLLASPPPNSIKLSKGASKELNRLGIEAIADCPESSKCSERLRSRRSTANNVAKMEEEIETEQDEWDPQEEEDNEDEEDEEEGSEQ